MSQNLAFPPEPMVILLLLDGRIMSHENRQLELLVEDLLEKKCRKFIFDFNRVDFIDSAGIGLIMKLAAVIRNAAGEVLLCNPRTNVKNVFIMLGIETRFRIFDQLGDALAHTGNLLKLEIITASL